MVDGRESQTVVVVVLWFGLLKSVCCAVLERRKWCDAASHTKDLSSFCLSVDNSPSQEPVVNFDDVRFRRIQLSVSILKVI